MQRSENLAFLTSTRESADEMNALHPRPLRSTRLISSPDPQTKQCPDSPPASLPPAAPRTKTPPRPRGTGQRRNPSAPSMGSAHPSRTSTEWPCVATKPLARHKTNRQPAHTTFPRSNSDPPSQPHPFLPRSSAALRKAFLKDTIRTPATWSPPSSPSPCPTTTGGCSAGHHPRRW